MKTQILTLLSISGLTLLSSPSSAQDELKWKFRSSESIKYNVVQNTKTTMKVGENVVDTVMNHTMDMAWKVLSVGANGDVVMNQTVNRVRMHLENPQLGKVNYDTAVGEKPDNQMLANMANTFQKIVNQPFQVTMKPSGQIAKVDVPQGLLEAVRAAAAGNPAAVDENALKEMMKQSAVTLPGEVVAPRSSWTSVQSIPLAFGTMNIQSKMTYLQKDDQGNAIINVEPHITVTPKEGAPVKMTLQSSEGRGQVTFNIVQGRVARSRLDLTLGMKIDSPTGQSFQQTIRQSTIMTLVP